MLTKNFYDMMRGFMLYSNVNVKDVAGTDVSVYYCLLGGNSYSSPSYGYGIRYGMRSGRTGAPKSSLGSGYGVYFGTGTTPAALTDITMEAPISNISVTSPSDIVWGVYDSYYELSSTFGVQNTSSTGSYAISEIGLFVQHQSSSNSTSAKTIMIEHTILSNPITLAPLEAKQITYTVRFKYPT